MKQTVVCASCLKQKAELKPRKSALLAKTTWLLCRSCFEGKYEPRWAIIASLRNNRTPDDVPDHVAALIRNHQYVGDEIKVRETLR